MPEWLKGLALKARVGTAHHRFESCWAHGLGFVYPSLCFSVFALLRKRLSPRLNSLAPKKSKLSLISSTNPLMQILQPSMPW